jgi:hypothetical protein
MAAPSEGEGVPAQLAFWELAGVWVCHGPTGVGGLEPVEGSMVIWSMAWTGISGVVSKLVDGLDQHFWLCKWLDDIEEAQTCFLAVQATPTTEKNEVNEVT